MNSSISSLQSIVAGKQDKLTFDSAPTSGSNNPVTSGGIFNAINENNSGFSCIIIPSPKLYGSYVMPVICSATSGSSLSTTYELDRTAQSWKKPLSDPTGKCTIPYIETKNEATLRTSTMRNYSIRSSTYSNYAGFIVKGSGTVKLYLSSMHIETTQTWVYSTNSTTRPYVQYDFVDGKLTGATIKYSACASSERVCTISVEDICEIEVS